MQSEKVKNTKTQKQTKKAKASNRGQRSQTVKPSKDQTRANRAGLKQHRRDWQEKLAENIGKAREPA